jgi:hypothetical protein
LPGNRPRAGPGDRLPKIAEYHNTEPMKLFTTVGLNTWV